MFVNFFATARQNNQWYWYLLSLIVILGFALLFSIPIFVIAGIHGAANTSDNLTAADLGVSEPIFLGLEMIPSIALTIGVAVCAVLIHKRPWQSLISAYPNIRWERYIFGNLLWFGLMIGAELVTYFIKPDNYIFQFNTGQFFALLIISLLMIPLQAAGEELIFRGYLMQGIGWATKRPWVALLITSIAFGSLHWGNPEMAKYGQGFIVTYMITGLFFGIITLMDEGLELAMGAHAINNIYNAVLVSFPASALELPTVFRIKEYDAWLIFAIELVIFALFIWVCAKKYGWNDWGKLVRKIEEPNTARL